MSLIEIDLGDSVTVRGTLTDEDGQPVTGATVTARVMPPSGTEEALGSAEDEGAGVYSITVTPDESGPNWVRLESAAPYLAAAEGVVYVRQSRFS